jgi:hypothetical protein
MRGYREPPAGLEELFHSFDLAAGRLTLSQGLVEPQVYASRSVWAGRAFSGSGGAPPIGRAEVFETEMEAGPPEQMAMMPVLRMTDGPPPAPAAAPMAKKKVGSAPPPPGGAPSAFETPMYDRASAALGGAGETDGGPPQAAMMGGPIEPGDSWLDFDALILAGPDEGGRGRLHRRPEPYVEGRDMAFYDVGSQARDLGLVAPIESRGPFDYRFAADGRIQVPADGLLHRVLLTEAEGRCEVTWRTTPGVEAAVYREVALKNPMEHPLLAGPVKVFVDGELRARTALKTVDRGGDLRIGLGIDDRLKVVRNVRVQEDGAGLLGGKRTVLHEVDIGLRSSLGFAVTVEVLERVPVTDEDTVDVELVSQRPVSRPYDQSERGRAIRGGRRWFVDLEAGGKKDITYSYKITLRAKDEIIGGNRRE